MASRLEATDFKELLEDLSNVDLTKALENAAGFLVLDVKSVTPVRTGALRASVDYEIGDDRVTIGSDLHYAGYVDNRTGFLTDTVREKAREYVEEEIMRAVEDAIG